MSGPILLFLRGIERQNFTFFDHSVVISINICVDWMTNRFKGNMAKWDRAQSVHRSDGDVEGTSFRHLGVTQFTLSILWCIYKTDVGCWKWCAYEQDVGTHQNRFCHNTTTYGNWHRNKPDLKAMRLFPTSKALTNVQILSAPSPQPDAGMWRVWVRRGRWIGSWWGNWRERDHWEDLGVDGWIILGWISRRWDVGIWTGLG